jgi:hypothetical protein
MCCWRHPAQLPVLIAVLALRTLVIDLFGTRGRRKRLNSVMLNPPRHVKEEALPHAFNKLAMSLIVSALGLAGPDVPSSSLFSLFALPCAIFGLARSSQRFGSHAPRPSPGLFHHHSDNFGSSHVHRTTLFSGGLFFCSGCTCIRLNEFRIIRMAFTYKNIPMERFVDLIKPRTLFCYSIRFPYNWYPFFTAGQLLLPIFKHHFLFTVVLLQLNLKPLSSAPSPPKRTRPTDPSQCVTHSCLHWL